MRLILAGTREAGRLCANRLQSTASVQSGSGYIGSAENYKGTFLTAGKSESHGQKMNDKKSAELLHKSDATPESILATSVAAKSARNTWTKAEISSIYHSPLLALTTAASAVHRSFHDPNVIQMCTLLSIKTGGCTEDCSYCAQSSRYPTGLKATKTVSLSHVISAAETARRNGSTRFCMGAAWREMRGRKTALREMKAMVSAVRGLGLEVCVTAGMLDESQAAELKSAGLTAYNHNLDTSREFYPSVITTRSYDDRLQTIDHVRNVGLSVCTGGILGLGEKGEDHVSLIHTVATMKQHPESFPVNTLVPIPGTPLAHNPPAPFHATLRTIATARIVMPATIIRLAAGRLSLSEEQQVMCFSAGANAVFTGEKMLTTDCSGWDEDNVLFHKWGLRPMKPFEGRPLEALHM